MSRPLIRLGLVFGALYFLQGLVETGDGLIAQPSRTLLERSGAGIGQIGDAMLLAALPWAMKPIYGLVSDAFPIFGSRRRSYLVLVSAATAAVLAALACGWVTIGGWGFVLCLAVATAGVAFADVVVDATMVETAQPLGLTGTIQAIQWGAIYTATALASWGGGVLSDAGLETMAFGAAAAASLAMIAVALAGLRSPAAGGSAGPRGLRAALVEMVAAFADPRLQVVAAMLALWSFTPGYGAVLDWHVTRTLALGERAYGDAAAVQALASAAACVVYGAVCRRVPFVWLLHASIGLGAFAAVVYAGVTDARSLLVVSAVSGAAYMLGGLGLLDLAARACPPRVAGSVFASLMAVQNLSLIVATWLGGHAYAAMEGTLDGSGAFTALALAGGAITAGCWLLMPAVRRALG